MLKWGFKLIVASFCQSVCRLLQLFYMFYSLSTIKELNSINFYINHPLIYIYDKTKGRTVNFENRNNVLMATLKDCCTTCRNANTNKRATI